MKRKNNIWKRWWLGLAYFSPVLPLYRNHPIDLLHISVDWFLYIYIFIYKNYDLCFKVAKKFFNQIFKFSLISAQYLPLRAVFYQFYDLIYRHCESIVLLKCCYLLEKKKRRCYLLEKKRRHRFIRLQLLHFQNFQPGELLGSCLGFDLNLSFSP